MILLEDSRQQVHKHDTKAAYFAEHGIEVHRTKLYTGDYTLPADQSVCVDTKFCIQELVGDICGPSHDRFREELIRAQESNIKLIILVENEFEWVNKKKNISNSVITDIDGLFKWINKRSFIWKNGKQLYPNATKGATLAKACKTMQNKYGVEFRFCDKRDSGRIILELLGVNVDGK